MSEYMTDDEPAGAFGDFGPELEASIRQATFTLMQALLPLATMYREQTLRINSLEDEIDRLHARVDEASGHSPADDPLDGGEPDWWVPLLDALLRNRNQLAQMTAGTALRHIGQEFGLEAMRFTKRYGLRNVQADPHAPWTPEHAELLDEVRREIHERAAAAEADPVPEPPVELQDELEGESPDAQPS